MIFQSADWTRIIIVFISQAFGIVLFLVLAFKILKRKRDRSTIALSAFYILMAIGLMFNILFIILTPLGNENILFIIYILASYLILFPFIFIIIFINIILKLEEIFTIKKIIGIIVIYGVLCSLLYFLPGGITFTSNWAPIYSISLFILICIFFTCFITIPTVYYSIRLYRVFKARNLKERLRLYLFGITLMIIIFYGGIYFITTSNELFKMLWSVFSFITEIVAGLLVYYGLGRNL